MNKEEIEIDKHYNDLYEQYEDKVKIPFQDYRDLEDKYEHLQCQVKDIISYIEDDDIVGAYEYIVSEGLK